MDIIINGRRIITNDPKLIEGFVREGAGKQVDGGRKSGRTNLIESRIKGELNRKPGAERR